jgi:hypothetical protein
MRNTIKEALKQVRADPELIELYHYYKDRVYMCIRELGPGNSIYTLVMHDIDPTKVCENTLDYSRFSSQSAE